MEEGEWNRERSREVLRLESRRFPRIEIGGSHIRSRLFDLFEADAAPAGSDHFLFESLTFQDACRAMFHTLPVALARRSRATSWNGRLSRSNRACLPVYPGSAALCSPGIWYRFPRERPCVFAVRKPINVDPDPPRRSKTMSPDLLLFWSARSTSSAGFIVGRRRLSASAKTCSGRSPCENILRPRDLIPDLKPGGFERLLELALPRGTVANVERGAGLHCHVAQAKRSFQEPRSDGLVP
jgi:hypothetical protein